jgi:hypothetical protein
MKVSVFLCLLVVALSAIASEEAEFRCPLPQQTISYQSVVLEAPAVTKKEIISLPNICLVHPFQNGWILNTSLIRNGSIKPEITLRCGQLELGARYIVNSEYQGGAIVEAQYHF